MIDIDPTTPVSDPIKAPSESRGATPRGFQAHAESTASGTTRTQIDLAAECRRHAQREAIVLFLAEEHQQRARARLARRLAPAVLQRLLIPPNDWTIPIWLNEVDTCDNEAATRNWIARQLGDPELADGSMGMDLVSILAGRVRDILVELDLLDALTGQP